MKKGTSYLFLLTVFLLLTSFTAHKFYLGIYQVNYAPEKKMLEITSRIFIDDLNKALEKKYKRKAFHIGTAEETDQEVTLFKKYLAENFIVKINGQVKPIVFLSKETAEDDVLVCYSKIVAVPKMNSIEIFNAVLIDWSSEQQNITHVTAFGTKKTILFTDSSRNGVLKF
ncbi:DUF6702 family protein [Flavobacterium sp.]|uniref:DUF6702 family protein n=1 Tax=Flavobacterium sp. TaxID=239 RepID=UPI00262D3C3D|nr:DUF6702 family protein [Flavobacterium sp.]MDG2433597.1 hypothetical protein [Flavobacterium sp.]